MNNEPPIHVVPSKQLVQGMVLLEPTVDEGPPSLWLVQSVGTDQAVLYALGYERTGGRALAGPPELADNWRIIDLDSLARLLDTVHRIGEETQPDLTYVFTDSVGGKFARDRRLRSAIGDDGYTALAKEIAALQEKEEQDG